MNEEIKKVIEGAKKHNLASEDLIELYSRIQILIDDNQEKYNYECYGSGIGQNAFDFSIAVKKNNPLPTELLALFFIKIENKFKITCKKWDNNDKPDIDRYQFKVTIY